ncbi:MAG TPA: hypothetical protein VHO67_15285 [Polyangia bacterium]|nr:hypothetical protein [Polyangia bacterium]
MRTLAVVVLLLVTAGAARAQEEPPPDTERLTARGEAGLEFDTNAHRTEIVAGAVNPPIVSSLVQRVVLSGALSDAIADGQAISMGATVAGKVFDAPEAADEDVAIAQTSLAWQKSLGTQSVLGLSGAYYEAFQRASASLAAAVERRDFRSLTPAAQLTWAAAEHLDLALTGGYRWFVFKPDRDVDFQAPTAGLELRWAHQPDSGADWEATLGAAYEYRTFGGPALTTDCPAPLRDRVPVGLACSGPETRHDTFVMGHVELTRVGRVLAGIGYALQDNRSNSYGETVIRHAFSARVALALPGRLMLAARGDLLLAFYAEHQPIGQVTILSATTVESIDSENRSTVRVDLSRDLTERLRLFARYTFYANELGTDSNLSYRRQTVLLSLLLTVDK